MNQYIILVSTNELTDLPILLDELKASFLKQNANVIMYELGPVNIKENREDPSIR